MEQKHNAGAPLLVTAILLTAFTMRSPMTSLSAILQDIQALFSLSGAAAGSLTTIPTILFAAVSLGAPMLLRHFRASTLLLMGTLFICVGVAARSFLGTPGLFAGTAAIGLGIGLCNIMIPKIIKQFFPNRIELFTGLYISTMTLFAALGSGASTPLEHAFGWQWGLMAWAVPALLAAAAWMVSGRFARASEEHAQPPMRMRALLKAPMAWKLTLCMGTQSVAYFCVLAWLPVILQDKGMEPEIAGFAHLIVQMVGMISAFSIPMLMRRSKDHRIVHIASCLAFLTGLVLLLIWTDRAWLQLVMLVTLGWGTGVGLAYTVTVLSLRASSSEELVSLSAMVQTGGYVMAAIGPMLLGSLFDACGLRNVQVAALIVFILGYLVFGTMVALRPGGSRGIE